MSIPSDSPNLSYFNSHVVNKYAEGDMQRWHYEHSVAVEIDTFVARIVTQ